MVIMKLSSNALKKAMTLLISVIVSLYAVEVGLIFLPTLAVNSGAAVNGPLPMEVER